MRSIARCFKPFVKAVPYYSLAMEVESSLLELSVAIFLHADLPACVMEPADTSDGVSVSVTKGLSHALNQAGFELGKMLTDYSIKGYIGLYTREVASLS